MYLERGHGGRGKARRGRKPQLFERKYLAGRVVLVGPVCSAMLFSVILWSVLRKYEKEDTKGKWGRVNAWAVVVVEKARESDVVEEG